MARRDAAGAAVVLRNASILTLVAAVTVGAAEPAREATTMNRTKMNRPMHSPSTNTNPEEQSVANTRQQAVLGAGCFWCVEAIFQRIPGVVSVEPGYAGGHVANPTYKQVCAGTTGHAEVTRIEFDPSQVSYAELLDVFWRAHDPTTLNRQGADVGTQYRSVVFYLGEEQKRIAEESKRSAQASGKFASPIVTAVEPLAAFYQAEDYHRDYYEQNRNAPYCQIVIRPKLEKLGLD
jgi:peptide-methionine (S)-S-oxide reductase